MGKKEKVNLRDFKLKIIAQYQRIFNNQRNDPLERRFFMDMYLLQCNFDELKSILDELSVDQLLLLQNNTRCLFKEGVSIIKKVDLLRLENVLDTLEIFIRSVFQKKYNNFTSDVVFIIAGLDNIDSIFMDFVISLDALIQKESRAVLRTKALRLCLCTACHGFNSNVVSYFHYKDFFPSIIKYITDPDTFSTAFLAFLFLGVLANNKKFESQNLYQTRLSDFVDNSTMRLIVNIISVICMECRNEYIFLKNNGPDNMWGIKNILTYFNDMFSPDYYKPVFENSCFISSENGAFMLPGYKASILLPMYDFINTNKAFCYIFITTRSSTNDLEIETPFSQFISFTSYLLEYQCLSLRASHYARLALLIIHILVSDNDCFLALANEANGSVVHLCRRKHSFLPLVKDKRILLLAIFDSLIISMDYNLKRKLDIEKYILQAQILLNIISILEEKKIKLEYHWQDVWRFFMHFIMFLLANSKTFKQLPRIDELVSILLNFISLCIIRGENFLLEFKFFEDLVYKLIQNGDIVKKFIKTYEIESSSSKIILLVTEYYENFLLKKYKPHELSPEKIIAAIKEGYGLFNLNLAENNEYIVPFKETKECVFLKSVARVAVLDADRLQLQ
ncbi:hypothetical protein PORY_000989 [Pneumocystis oryctolagi]|uniref:Uncharacterized protein n=1 Tax=Pneumocystis oryctolagi TaxID=42067 RepID=A0ACB7CEN3_9ASCO|nr:hypothetical protein PORY_000989 [Pneumocystis oryctolagi]